MMLLEISFWLCMALVGYAYAGYPALIWVLSRLFGQVPLPPEIDEEFIPAASLVLAAFNEEEVIGERIRNALAMDYPHEKLELVIGSDGSTDGTADVVRSYAQPGVRLLDFPSNRGKATVLNDAANDANGEILLMSDANTQVDPEAAANLVRWFADPKVGVVVGRLVLVDSESGQNVDGVYWRYETFLKRQESSLGALLGANGAIYAMRKALFVPVPPDTIIDDFVIPLLAKLRTGCKIIYDCNAIAREESAPDIASEFRRRVRIGAGDYQSIKMLWRLLDPRMGWISLAFFSHKILRWLCPFFLIGMLLTCIPLSDHLFYRAALIVQVISYPILGYLGLRSPVRMPKLINLASMFVTINLATSLRLLQMAFRYAGGRRGNVPRDLARLSAWVHEHRRSANYDQEHAR